MMEPEASQPKINGAFLTSRLLGSSIKSALWGGGLGVALGLVMTVLYKVWGVPPIMLSLTASPALGVTTFVVVGHRTTKTLKAEMVSHVAPERKANLSYDFDRKAQRVGHLSALLPAAIASLTLYAASIWVVNKVAGRQALTKPVAASVGQK